MRIRRILATTAAVLAGPLFLASCGGGGTSTGEVSGDVSASDVAMMYVDAFRGESDALRDYNANSSWDDSYFETAGTGLSQAQGIEFTEEQAAAVADAYRTALSAVEAEAVEEKVDGDTATVGLSIRGVDLAGAMAAHQKQLAAAAVAEDPAAYADAVVAMLGDTDLVAEPTDVEMTLTRGGDDLWGPDSSSAPDLIAAVAQWS